MLGSLDPDEVEKGLGVRDMPVDDANSRRVSSESLYISFSYSAERPVFPDGSLRSRVRTTSRLSSKPGQVRLNRTGASIRLVSTRASSPAISRNMRIQTTRQTDLRRGQPLVLSMLPLSLGSSILSHPLCTQALRYALDFMYWLYVLNKCTL